MPGNRKKWDGTLNAGGVICGLALGAIVGIFVFTSFDINNMPRWATKAPILAVVGGAYVGTIAWGKFSGKP